MPLTQEQEELEHALRVDEMTVNIEQMRADMAAQQKQLEWETRKFVVQLVAGLSTAFAAGAAVAGLVLHLMGRL